MCSNLQVLHSADLIPHLKTLLAGCVHVVELLPGEVVCVARQLLRSLFCCNFAAIAAKSGEEGGKAERKNSLTSSKTNSTSTASLMSKANSTSTALLTSKTNSTSTAVKDSSNLSIQRSYSSFGNNTQVIGKEEFGLFSNLLPRSSIAHAVESRNPLNENCSNSSIHLQQHHRPPASVRHTLSSYIRLFEPIVINCLNSYTITCDDQLQVSVLRLLTCLVRIRVNYSLLDSSQVFLKYVISQLEYIQDGTMRGKEVLMEEIFEFLVLVSCERQNNRVILEIEKVVGMCEDFTCKSMKKVLLHVTSRVFSTQFIEENRETGFALREAVFDTILRNVNDYQSVSLLNLIVQAVRSDAAEYSVASNRIANTLLPQLSSHLVHLPSVEAIDSVYEVLSSLSPTVYENPDFILKLLFSSPDEVLESSSSVCTWVGCITIGVRLLLAKSSSHVVFTVLGNMGLTLQFVNQVKSDPSVPYSPLRKRNLSVNSSTVASDETNSDDVYSDPLNVSQNSLKPEMALAKLILEVLRVCLSELLIVWQSSSQVPQTTQTIAEERMLTAMAEEFMTHIIHMSQNDSWKGVASKLEAIISRDARESFEEIVECCTFLRCAYPQLIIMALKMNTQLYLAPSYLWPVSLRSQHKGCRTAVVPAKLMEGSPNILSLNFLRTTSVLLFCRYVSKSISEDAWLAWLLLNHAADIVKLVTLFTINKTDETESGGNTNSVEASEMVTEAAHRMSSLNLAVCYESGSSTNTIGKYVLNICFKYYILILCCYIEEFCLYS